MKSVYGIPVLDLKMLPEQMVMDAADMYREEDPENSFVRLLRAGEEFKDAGLTPIYLTDKPMKRMMVTTKEKMQKKYH